MHSCLKFSRLVYHRAVIKFTIHLPYPYHQNDRLYSADLHQSQEDTLAKVVDIHLTPSVANPLILLTAAYWPYIRFVVGPGFKKNMQDTMLARR